MAEIEDIEERFWARVNFFGPTPAHVPGNCWEWTGHRDKFGYGKVWLRKTWKAHRAAWVIVYGMPPPDMPCVLHDCDNPACVRLEHLHVGTVRQNNEERDARGRGARRSGDAHHARLRPECMSRGDAHYSRVHPERLARGERSGHCKLTTERVREIRRRFDRGDSREQIARDVGTTRGNVFFIGQRKTWKHVPE